MHSQTTVAWHDQTPIGRIISRLSKDIISLDDQLPTQFNQLMTQGLSILGTIALVFYSFPILGSIFPFMFFLYGCTAAFYRSSSREVKRIDSNVSCSACYPPSHWPLTPSTLTRRCGPSFTPTWER